MPGRASIRTAPLTARYLPLFSARNDVRADATLATAPAVVATVLPAPRPPAKPGHKRRSRTSSAASARSRAHARSSPVARTAERSKKLLADAPRRPHPASEQQLVRALAPPAHAAVHEHERGPLHGGELPCPCRCRGNRVEHASSAIAPPQPCTRRRSTAPGGTEDGTTGSTPSAGSGAAVESAESSGGLDQNNVSSDPAPGPREVSAPCRSSLGAELLTPRRGASFSVDYASRPAAWIIPGARQWSRGSRAILGPRAHPPRPHDPHPGSATVSGPPATRPSGPPAAKALAASRS
jgi:hypothetical protein